MEILDSETISKKAEEPNTVLAHSRNSADICRTNAHIDKGMRVE